MCTSLVWAPIELLSSQQGPARVLSRLPVNRATASALCKLRAGRTPRQGGARAWERMTGTMRPRRAPRPRAGPLKRLPSAARTPSINGYTASGTFGSLRAANFTLEGHGTHGPQMRCSCGTFLREDAASDEIIDRNDPADPYAFRCGERCSGGDAGRACLRPPPRHCRRSGASRAPDHDYVVPSAALVTILDDDEVLDGVEVTTK